MPIVAKGFVVVTLQLFGNKFVFELANLVGGQDRVLRARDHAPFGRLSFFVPLLKHDGTPFFEFVEHLPGRLQSVRGCEAWIQNSCSAELLKFIERRRRPWTVIRRDDRRGYAPASFFNLFSLSKRV